MTTDYAASVQGVSIRITRLDVNGNLLAGEMDCYTTSAFIRTSFTPEYEEGDEITEKAADGTVCVSFKAPDTLKRVTMEIAICDPDPEISALLSGGLLLTDVDKQGNQTSVGWASAQTGEDPSGNGVAVEVWSRAIQNGKPAPSNPYFHWVFPYVKTRLSGDRVIENGLLATTFEGFGLGNINFRSGPDGSWKWPAATDRPYLYARTPWAPQGIRGFYQWNPGTPYDAGPPATDAVPPTTQPAPTETPDLGIGFNVSNGGTIYPNDINLVRDPVLSADDYLSDATGTLEYPASAAIQSVRNVPPAGAIPLPVTYLARGGTTPPIVATGATTGTPGTFTPTGAVAPANLAALSTVTATPTSAWLTDEYVELADSSTAHWSGSAWVTGITP